MSSHTKGPWVIESPNGNIRASVTQPRSGSPINTHIFMACLDNGTSYDERIANARLIAAAPELLEAAENALAYLGGQLDPSASEAYEALSAAIAKATGEQP